MLPRLDWASGLPLPWGCWSASQTSRSHSNTSISPPIAPSVPLQIPSENYQAKEGFCPKHLPREFGWSPTPSTIAACLGRLGGSLQNDSARRVLWYRMGLCVACSPICHCDSTLADTRRTCSL